MSAGKEEETKQVAEEGRENKGTTMPPPDSQPSGSGQRKGTPHPKNVSAAMSTVFTRALIQIAVDLSALTMWRTSRDSSSGKFRGSYPKQSSMHTIKREDVNWSWITLDFLRTDSATLIVPLFIVFSLSFSIVEYEPCRGAPRTRTRRAMAAVFWRRYRSFSNTTDNPPLLYMYCIFFG